MLFFLVWLMLVPNPAFQVEDIAAPAGLRFRQNNFATPSKYPFETMGGAVAAFDFNNDGLLDLLHQRAGRLAGGDEGGMKVFVVWHECYETVLGVYSTEEHAQAACDAIRCFLQILDAAALSLRVGVVVE